MLCIFIALLLAMVSCSPLDFVVDDGQSNGTDAGYYYENLDIDVVVKDDHSYHVTWNCDIFYREESHGFYIFTPYIAEVALKGANYNHYQLKYAGFAVTGAPYEVYTENLNYVIKVGDPNKLVKGMQSYTLSYTCKVGKDFSEAADFVYWNIIGPFMNTLIKNVSFTVTLPHAVDVGTQAKLYKGQFGSDFSVTLPTEDGVTFSYTTTSLGSYNGLTMYLELQNGYYTDVKDNAWIMITVFILTGIASVLLCYWIYRKYGVDRRVPPTAEFEAPPGVDSASAGYILDGSADTKDIVSLIFWFADKGYLAIEEQENDTFLLKKVKDFPDEGGKHLNLVFDGLFHRRDSVSTAGLNEQFFHTTAAGKTALTNFWRRKIFDVKSTWMQGVCAFVSVLPMLVCIVWSLLSTFALVDTGMVIFLFAAVGLVWVTQLILSRWVIARMAWSFGKNLGLVASAMLILLAALAMFFFIMPAFLVDVMRISAYMPLFTLFCIPIVMFCGRKTIEGEQLYAKLLGFRTFIEKAEKDRIETLIEQDPGFFYHVLPYAYAMGVTEKWAKKFEKIALQPPIWYASNSMDVFTFHVFMHSFYRSTLVMNRTMISRPQVKTSGGGFRGGGFGGGGFSGGGFGGGGGGRW